MPIISSLHVKDTLRQEIVFSMNCFSNNSPVSWHVIRMLNEGIYWGLLSLENDEQLRTNTSAKHFTPGAAK